MADREVRLNRAKWIGPSAIRLRFDPFAYRHIRLKVLTRDGYTCYWCGGYGDTIDHVIPWSKGGRTTMDNCVCACQECNGLRGDMPAAEFAKLRKVRPPQLSGGRPVIISRPVPAKGPQPEPASEEAGDKEITALGETAATTEVIEIPEPPSSAIYALKWLLDPYHRVPARRAFY